MPDPVVPAVPAASAPAATTPAPASTPPAAPASPAATPSEKTGVAAAPIAAEAAKTPDAPARPESLLPEIGEAAKPDGEKPAEAKPAEAGAPEKYEFKLPEGVKLNAEMQTEFETFARGENLSNAVAQSLLDRHIQAITQQKQADLNAWFDTQKSWQAEIQADKTIGGEKLPISKQAIGRVINFLGPDLGPKFREALDFTGAGNNPAVYRGLVKLAERFSEGSSVNGKPSVSPGAAKNAASVMYPTHQKT